MLRSVNDVDRVIEFAKLDPRDLSDYSQVIQFDHERLNESQIKLLEVEKSMVEKLEAQDVLIIKGTGQDGTVLCTKDKTFDMKEAETSNSLLVLDGLSYPTKDSSTLDSDDGTRQLEERKVMGVFHHYLEIKVCKPRFKRLYEILNENRLTSKHDLEENTGSSLADLQNLIQCSNEELSTELNVIEACLIGQKWYWLNFEYKMRIVSLIFTYFDENSWDFDDVKKRDTIEALKDIDNEEVIDAIFDIFVTEVGGKYQVIAEKVSRFFGEYLLQTTSKFDLDEFQSMWEQAVPENIQTDLNHLRGIAFVDRNCSRFTISHFPERDLPENITERFQILFQMQEKWSVEEIEPFVEKLTTPKLNVNGLLTKYARGSTVNGKKLFSSKHGK